jgi:hypothetical protein
MLQQTGPQVWCSQTGKMKNCPTGVWADYEEGQRNGAALCNGGIYSGKTYDPCPSRTECRAATERAAAEEEQRVRLPQYQQPQGTRFLAGTPAARQNIPAAQPLRNGYGQSTTLTSARPQTTQYHQQYVPPRPDVLQPPVQLPEHYPTALRTPFAAPAPVGMGGVSPTFLPNDEDERLFVRLFKNITQGAISSTGWHVFDFSRNVDLFPHQRRKK